MATRVGFGDYQYELVEGWPKLPRKGVASDVAVDSKGRAYVALREWPHPETTGGAILVFDKNGNHIESWGEDLYTTPHGIWISPDDEIFVADSTDHTVRKYATSGEILMTIGVKDRPGEPRRSVQPSYQSRSVAIGGDIRRRWLRSESRA